MPQQRSKGWDILLNSIFSSDAIRSDAWEQACQSKREIKFIEDYDSLGNCITMLFSSGRYHAMELQNYGSMPNDPKC